MAREQQPASALFRRFVEFAPIEILVVSGTLAVLLLVGFANLCTAQSRSQMTRVRTDFAQIRRALHAYRADHSAHARHSWPCPPIEDRIDGELVSQTLAPIMTSPIAYLTTIPADPFRTSSKLSQANKFYKYVNSEQARDTLQFANHCDTAVDDGFTIFDSTSHYLAWRYYFGSYLLVSAGPDGQFRDSDVSQAQYDPTNGTVSSGSIIISEYSSVPVHFPHFALWDR